MSDIETVENGIDRQPAYTRVGEIVVSAKTLRDEFAMAALTGLLAANATYGGRTDNRECLTMDAYQTANAMMKARNL